MKTPETYPLIPKPLPVDNGNIHGKLYIKGRPEDNSLSFCLVFDDPEDLAPLAISVKAAGKSYTFYCLIRNHMNGSPCIETPLFKSPFYVGEKFTVTAVEELIKFEIENNAKKFIPRTLNPRDLWQ
jgi:hypothetical protein